MASDNKKRDLVVINEEAYNETISQIRGVISGRVVFNKAGQIDEVHVLANMERAPKQIVRDIESALMVKFGITLNHKKVSIVQMAEESEEVNPEWRPLLLSVNSTTTGLKVECRVRIKVGENVSEGISIGPNSASNRLRIVATATLDALEKYLEGRAAFVVEDLAKISLAQREVVLVSVSIVNAHGTDILLGASFVKEDEREAAAKATLGAVTRKLAFFPTE